MKKSIKDRILDAFKAKDEEGMKKALEEVKDDEAGASGMVNQAIAGLGASVPIPEELTAMQTVMSRLGETWKRQFLAEGRAEGRAEGEARALLLLAEQRFGALPTALRERIQGADAASIEEWLGRLLDATSLETLFDSGRPGRV